VLELLTNTGSKKCEKFNFFKKGVFFRGGDGPKDAFFSQKPLESSKFQNSKYISPHF
jgi:hypothetical protein